MRFACALVLLAGCGFRAHELADAPPMFDDGGHEIRMWNFDTAADFGAPGSQTIAMSVDPRGSLTPAGYIYGALLATGFDNMRLWAHGDSGWDKMLGITPSGVGLWTGNNLNVTDDLRYVGVTHRALSIAFEGEVFLLAGGNQKLHVQGNDIGFIQLAKPGTADYVQVADNMDATVNVPAAAWYPIRVGWGNADTTGDFTFTHSDNGMPLKPWTRDRIRASTTHLSGTMRSVYYHQLHGGGIVADPPIFQLEPGALSPVTAFNPPLQGSYTGIAATASDWSARWTGQFYAEVPGDYTFKVDSADGNRLMLGDKVQESHWARDDNGAASSTTTATLVEGWNDLVVDYNNGTSTPSFGVSIVSSPDASLAAGPIPADRLRPIEPTAERLAHVGNTNSVTVGDNQSKGYPFTIATLAADEVVTAVEATVLFTTQDESQLTFKVTETNTHVFQATGPISGAAGGLRALGLYITDSAFLNGIAADGPWAVTITDKPGGGSANTTVFEVHLTVHTKAGAKQIAVASTWTSPIVDTMTKLFAVDSVTWDERLPAGSGLVVGMRSCDLADCSDGTWSDPIAKTIPPALPAKRYLQTRVDLTSDGIREPELKSLMIVYRRDVM